MQPHERLESDALRIHLHGPDGERELTVGPVEPVARPDRPPPVVAPAPPRRNLHLVQAGETQAPARSIASPARVRVTRAAERPRTLRRELVSCGIPIVDPTVVARHKQDSLQRIRRGVWRREAMRPALALANLLLNGTAFMVTLATTLFGLLFGAIGVVLANDWVVVTITATVCGPYWGLLAILALGTRRRWQWVDDLDNSIGWWERLAAREIPLRDRRLSDRAYKALGIAGVRVFVQKLKADPLVFVERGHLWWREMHCVGGWQTGNDEIDNA